MNSFDTIKISIPREVVRAFKPEAFYTKSSKGLEKKVLTNNLPRYLRCPGLVDVAIADDDTTIIISSKLLSSFGLINNNNITDAIRQLNESGVITVDSDTLLDAAEVCRIDVAQNLRMQRVTNEYIPVLAGISAEGVSCRLYGEKSIVFSGPGAKDRVTFYLKYYELFDHPGYIRALSPNKRAAILAESKDVMRVELNIRTYADIKYKFGIDTRKLSDVLNSKTPVLANYFNYLLSGGFAAIPESDESFDHFLKVQGMHRILEEHAGDPERAKAVIKDKNCNVSSPQRKLLHEAIQQRNKTAVSNPRILEIQQKLYAQEA
ncbi:MAG: hypothetical protein AABZ39_04940 [Spirochaetota bacterium]